MKKFAVIALALALGACGSVDAGEVGLFNRYGNISNEVAGPGMHFYNPLTTSLETFNVKSKRLDGETATYTQDLQQAGVKYALTYSLDRNAVVNLRKTVGAEYENTLIPPVVESNIKNVFAHYTAMNAVAQRPQVQQNIENAVRAALARRGIKVESFQMTNIDYSDEFEHAVERAQVATQQAVAARNATVRVREEATQAVVKAEGEARAIQVRAAALQANPNLTQYEAVQKWDGHLPEYMLGNSTPFISLGK